MTAPLAKWLTEVSQNTAMEDEPAERSIETTIEQRIAVALLQARAAESRNIAGELQIAGLTQNPIFYKMMLKLQERSKDLEAQALKLCTEWPIEVDEETPKPKLVHLAHN
jgi:hypothetical protein